MALAGGICITAQVYYSVVNRIDCGFESIGNPILKNVSIPVEVFRASSLGVDSSKHVVQTASTRSKNRIAVLPFANMSSDPNDEYFADGMTEELISTISKISGLQVIARTSVIRYKGSTKSIEEIGKELKTGTILEGSVRKAGDKLRITAQLIDSQDSIHLWSETYDRELKDIFGIQSDISRTVANELRVKLGAKEEVSIGKESTRNMGAYNMFLRGMHVFVNGFLKDDILKAISFFEKAVDLDQSFAVAYSWLAESYMWLADTGYLSLDERRATLSKADMAVRNALQLDLELSDAHLVLSSVKQTELDWVSAEREIRRALELNPNVPRGHEAYAWLLVSFRRVEEAAAQAKMGLELNPLDFMANRTSVLISYLKKDYDNCIVELKKMADLYSGNLSVRIAADLGLVYLSNSDFPNAIREFQRALQLDYGEQKYAGTLSGLGFAYAKLGQKQEARKILDDLKTMSTTRFVPYGSIAQIHLALGEKEEAIEALERAYKERDVQSLFNLRFLAPYDELRAEPRFIALLEKIGLISREEASQADRNTNKATL